MALDVVGAGFGRTGTLSLKFALEKLGFDRCYHMMEVRQHPDHIEYWSRAHRGEPVDWDVVFEGYRAAVDWPACNWWRELAAYYPDSKVILTTRDPERWFESVHNTIYMSTTKSLQSDDPAVRRRGEWIYEIVWKRVFDGRMDDKAHVLDVLRRHEAEVKATIPPSRLLVFDAAEGWAPLCRFLERPTPDEPYPRVNTTEDFQMSWRNIDRGGGQGGQASQ